MDAKNSAESSDGPNALSDQAAVEKLHDARSRLVSEIEKVIVGQATVIDQLLVALFAGGHCLLVGVPGLAKTLMIRTLADALALHFRRIQFTPDLMPADITGTEVIQFDQATGDRSFRFVKGPVFANVLLADEINRTPPKTQAALLEAMQERQVTAAGERHPLDEPFFVLATQNPIEHEGTYPLPEAQLDRFMLQIKVEYPTEAEELAIVLRDPLAEVESVEEVLSGRELNELRRVIGRIPIAEHLATYALRLVRRTRPDEEAPDFVKEYIAWGAGPRASQHLVSAARAHAVLQGRFMVTQDDILQVAAPVLRHRLQLNFNADSDGVTADDLIRRLIQSVPIASKESSRGLLPDLLGPKSSRQD